MPTPALSIPKSSDVRFKSEFRHEKNRKQKRGDERADVIERENARDELFEIELVL
jgi:hypothetical protein